ncbi:mechanosensitive ion channel family protein [Spirulina sp. CS-785/01]|uniref:mechanosensitive ion channel family protein n=1 Tax=Spirulina sp. CS-785/01 TaxID=3021716 RepID=UPI00232A91F9|nr:mechanosensitive ion channel family protein [Spirulina sp. CS-785/01]MDB9312461.1 mechanosensitive ion channel family protein [Spirulina sp. CS-785/01]
MNFSDFWKFFTTLDQQVAKSAVPNYLIFLGFALLSILIGNLSPGLLRFVFYRLLPKQGQAIYNTLTQTSQDTIKISSTLILLRWSLNWLEPYSPIYDFFRPVMALAITISVAWLISQVFRQLVRGYGISLVQKIGLEVDEIILPFEAVVNVLIGLFAALAFANSQDINLVGFIASLGILATAIGLAAQSAISQLIGTIVIYLDRPYIKGDYIRLPNGIYGRIESIGLRSTKVRTAAKSTLMIIPNSKMGDVEIENITRGKKVMVLLYLDFQRLLEPQEEALVEQVVKDSTNAINGIDPGSTKITLNPLENKKQTRARVTFFILGSMENSIQLRKRLLEIANDNISKELAAHGIEFYTQDPTIYVESPMTL